MRTNLKAYTNSSSKVKICGITSYRDLQTVLQFPQVNHLGFVSAMPSGPCIISDEAIRMLLRKTPSFIDTFLLTSRCDAEGIAEQWRLCRTTTIQVCNPLPDDELRRLRKLVPGISLVSVVHINSRTHNGRALELCNIVDGLLLDTGDPDMPLPELGGTGRVHDWDISRNICAQSSLPVWLAGGLTAKNVAAAISYVRPQGIDVCTGVRSDGFVDGEKLAALLGEIERSHPGKK